VNRSTGLVKRRGDWGSRLDIVRKTIRAFINKDMDAKGWVEVHFTAVLICVLGEEEGMFNAVTIAREYGSGGLAEVDAAWRSGWVEVCWTARSSNGLAAMGKIDVAGPKKRTNIAERGGSGC